MFRHPAYFTSPAACKDAAVVAFLLLSLVGGHHLAAAQDSGPSIVIFIVPPLTFMLMAVGIFTCVFCFAWHARKRQLGHPTHFVGTTPVSVGTTPVTVGTTPVTMGTTPATFGVTPGMTVTGSNFATMTTQPGGAPIVVPIPETNLMQYGDERAVITTPQGITSNVPVPANPEQREFMLNTLRQQGNHVELQTASGLHPPQSTAPVADVSQQQTSNFGPQQQQLSTAPPPLYGAAAAYPSHLVQATTSERPEPPESPEPNLHRTKKEDKLTDFNFS